MTTLLLIRHGESEANKAGVFAGFTDAALTEKGLEQANITAQYIADNYNVDKIYASDLKRAYATGKALSDLKNIEIVPSDRLREISAGKWEGKKYSQLTSEFEEEYAVWLTDIGNCRCTGGESTAELGERIINALTQIAKDNEGKIIAVATHATPIRAMQTYVQYGDLSKMKDVPWVSNASVTTFIYNNGTWSCTEVSHDEHLADMVTLLPKDC